MNKLLSLVIVALFLSLSACGSKNSKESWPEEVQQEMITSCKADPANTEAICECMISKMVETFDYKEVQAMQKSIMDGIEPTADVQRVLNTMQEITASCQE